MSLTTAPLKKTHFEFLSAPATYLEMLPLPLYKLGEFTLEGDGPSIQRVEESRQQQTLELV